jgi:division protein CdvB (Snf7/Vps24/ESCRT-III family)
MELLKKYQEQYEEFMKIDSFNLEERTKRIPAEKHFWVCRFIDAKIQRDRLIKQKSKLKSGIEQKLMTESPVRIDKSYMSKIEDSPTLENINDKIKEQEYLIEYLDLVVRQITYIAQDVKNMIDIQKLETM